MVHFLIFFSLSGRPRETSSCRTSRSFRRSSTKETKILRQKVRYKGGQVVQGKLVDGEVDFAETITETRSPTAKGAMWLLARRFPMEWGQPQLEQEEAREGEAHDGKPRVVHYIPDNGRMRKMPGDEIVQLPEESEMAQRGSKEMNDE